MDVTFGGGNVNLNPVPIFKFTYYFATEFMTSLYIVANPLLDKGYFFQICFIYSDLKCLLILPTPKSFSYFSQTTFFNMSPSHFHVPSCFVSELTMSSQCLLTVQEARSAVNSWVQQWVTPKKQCFRTLLSILWLLPSFHPSSSLYPEPWGGDTDVTFRVT